MYFFCRIIEHVSLLKLSHLYKDVFCESTQKITNVLFLKSPPAPDLAPDIVALLHIRSAHSVGHTPKQQGPHETWP